MIDIRKLKIIGPAPMLFFGVVPAELTFVFDSELPSGAYTLKGDTSFESRAPVIDAAKTLTEAASQITFEVACNSQAFLDRISTASKLHIQLTGPAGVLVYDDITAAPSVNPTDIPTTAAPMYYNAEESDARFATLESVAELTDTVNATNTTVNTIAANLAAVKATGEATNTKVDAIATDLTAVKGTVDTFATTLNNMSNQVSAWLQSPVQ